MGILGFYKWASSALALGKPFKQNQFFIKYKQSDSVEELYIDANSIIHNSLHKLINLKTFCFLLIF